MNLQPLLFKLLHSAKRAVMGIRQRPWLHVMSFVTLVAAFLSFGATLTVAKNFDSLLDHWVGHGELTIYLKNDVGVKEIRELAAVLETVDGIEAVGVITQDNARKEFVTAMGELGDVAGNIPAEAFPASIEVRLQSNVAADPSTRAALAARIEQVQIVESVDLYRSWFERISAMSLMGRFAAWGLGLLSFAVTVLVVAAVIRSGLFARRREVEVLHMFGAGGLQIKAPFIVEGALQAILSMVVAVTILNVGTSILANQLTGLMPLIGSADLQRISGSLVFVMVGGAAMAGIAGATLSVRAIKGAAQ